MGNRTVAVKIYSPTLSLLLYDNINSKYEQEGFLLGHTNTTIVKSVTDITREELKVKEEISITGILPCDISNYIYRPSGELITDKLKEILGNQKKNVVAWFKYKKFRKHGFKFSVRERVLHEELTDYFNINPYLFTCCLLTKSQSLNKSTQILSHAFLNMCEGNIRVVPLHIKNLGDPCHIYQSNVKPSETFLKLYSKINKDQSDLKIREDIFDNLKKDLGKHVTNLESSERRLCELKKEVDDLKNKLLKSLLEANQFPSEELNNETDLDKLQIEVPITQDVLSNESEADPIECENDLNSSSAVVDLTFSDNDDEDLIQNNKLRGRKK